MRHHALGINAQSTRREAPRLSLDINPRAFVVPCIAEQAKAAEPLDLLDAVFVPTRGRPQYLSRLLMNLQNSAPVFLLPTCDADYEGVISESASGVRVLWYTDPEFLHRLQLLRCLSNRMCFALGTEWDLPTKRNYALWYARRRGFRRILLLDDDIRISTPAFGVGASVLGRFKLCGLFIEEFPDTSVIGHVQIALGETVWTFLSGSALFLRADLDLGFFPPIYNEDWLFIVPHVLQEQVAVIGSAHQEPYSPFADPSLAMTQEPGEIIGDGLFALLQANAYDRRFDQVTWREILKLRREQLMRLEAGVSSDREQACVAIALMRCEEISEHDCVQFIVDWEHDRETWHSMVRGGEWS